MERMDFQKKYEVSIDKVCFNKMVTKVVDHICASVEKCSWWVILIIIPAIPLAINKSKIGMSISDLYIKLISIFFAIFAYIVAVPLYIPAKYKDIRGIKPKPKVPRAKMIESNTRS